MNYQFTEEFAHAMDAADSLAHFRNEFYIPQHNGSDAVYLCGNSLGLLPKRSEAAVQQEFEDWKTHGVEGHFRAKTPWFSYHKIFAKPLATLVGAFPHEVVCMNALTVNVHLMMTSFYLPTATRNKILILGQEFPSDRYAAESQVQLHGLNRDECIVELHPRQGENTLRTEDIIQTIQQLGNSLCLVHLSAVHYYVGQWYDMQAITNAAHSVGAHIGWDLAHAIGNVPLELHNWNVDYAAWCSYKYLNSGPGGVAGVFVHERHCNNTELPRFAGWWGNDESVRFTMPQWFTPVQTAESWQLSNAPVFPMALHKASLDIYEEAGIHNLRAKSIQLTGYLEYVINTVANEFPAHRLHIITPQYPTERGAQLSTIASNNGKQIFDYLSEHGVITDWRNPDVIRMAPAPLYNSFTDVYRFGQILRSCVQTL
ncbi:MAG: kynureninase [Candidatus Kapaibacterium sp.]